MSQISIDTAAILQAGRGAIDAAKTYLNSKAGRAFVYDAARVIGAAFAMNMAVSLARFAVRWLNGPTLSPEDRRTQEFARRAIGSCNDADEALEMARTNIDLLAKASDELKGNLDFALSVVALPGNGISHLSEEMRSHPEVVAAAIVAHPRRILEKSESEEYVFSTEAIQAAFGNGQFTLANALITYAKDVFEDGERNNPAIQRIMRVAPDHCKEFTDNDGNTELAIIDANLALELLDSDYIVIPYLHPDLIDGDKFPFDAIKRDARLVKELSEHFDLSVYFLLEAVQSNSAALEEIDLWEVYEEYGDHALELLAYEPSLAAKWRDATRSSGVPELTDEIFNAMVWQNADILEFFPDVTSNDEVMEKLIRDVNPRALAFASDECVDNADLVRAAALKDPYSFKFGSDRLRDDTDFVSELVARQSEVYLYAGDVPRSSMLLLESVLLANPTYIEKYVGEYQEENKDFWIEFVSRYAGALEYLPPGACDDKDIVRTAVTAHPEAIVFIGDELRDDTDFLVSLITEVNFSILLHIDDPFVLRPILEALEKDLPTDEGLGLDIARYLLSKSGSFYPNLPDVLMENEEIATRALESDPSMVYSLPDALLETDFLVNYVKENIDFLQEIEDPEFVARKIVSKDITLLDQIENRELGHGVAIYLIEDAGEGEEDAIRQCLALYPECVRELPEGPYSTMSFLASVGRINPDIRQCIAGEQLGLYDAALAGEEE